MEHSKSPTGQLIKLFAQGDARKQPRREKTHINKVEGNGPKLLPRKHRLPRRGSVSFCLHKQGSSQTQSSV